MQDACNGRNYPRTAASERDVLESRDDVLRERLRQAIVLNLRKIGKGIIRGIVGARLNKAVCIKLQLSLGRSH